MSGRREWIKLSRLKRSIVKLESHVMHKGTSSRSHGNGDVTRETSARLDVKIVTPRRRRRPAVVTESVLLFFHILFVPRIAKTVLNWIRRRCEQLHAAARFCDLQRQRQIATLYGEPSLRLSKQSSRLNQVKSFVSVKNKDRRKRYQQP